MDPLQSAGADALFSATNNQQAQFDNLSNNALSRGINAFMQGDYQKAVTEFRRSIGLSPYSENALKTFQFMADAYLNMGRPDEAISAYNQAARLYPSSDTPLLNLGNIYFQEGRYREAEDAYKKAVGLNPSAPINVYSLGQVYSATGRYAEAETQFRKVQQISPRDPSSFYALGQTYRRMGRYDDAISQLESAIGINKNFADVHVELGLNYLDMKNYDKAWEQVDILSDMDTALSAELQNQILKASPPKLLTAYNLSGFNMLAGPGTQVSEFDPSLASAESSKTFTMNFIFSKDMDTISVQNISNWGISRENGTNSGGPYNWGIQLPSSEVTIPSIPLSVIYHPDTLTADVMFRITQNAAADGTIDPSHILFRFYGKDAYGNAMDTSADEYSGLSKIV
ncbi:MAG: tetratricopeptide repeat protein [Nitrospirae bacterium]|nr:tetratricopeptide repeat protein [Nitrospirota bacterium]